MTFRQLQVSLPQATIDSVRDLATRRGVSVSHVLRAAVAAYLLDPDANLRRQLAAASAPAPAPAPAVVVAPPQPPPGTWRRPAADPLAPRC
jgi:hypothetical protein